jgi:hypothetical protein
MNLSMPQLRYLMAVAPKMKFASVVRLSFNTGIDLLGLMNIRNAASRTVEDESEIEQLDNLDEFVMKDKKIFLLKAY